MFKHVTLSSLLLLLLLAPAATADVTWSWGNGFKLADKDKGYSLKFGGRIQADYSLFSPDASLEAAVGSFDDGFEFRRARLFFEGDIYDKISFKAQYDFAGGEAAAKDVWIALDLGPELKFGHFKEPFSMEELTSSKYIAFAERSLPNVFAPSRNSGIGLAGSTDKITWGVGYFYDADDFGESTSSDNTNLTGRIAFHPLNEDGRVFHVGVQASTQDRASTVRWRQRPEAHLTPRVVDTGSLASTGADIVGVEIAGTAKSFWYHGEYAQADTDLIGARSATFSGSTLMVGYYLTGESRSYKASEGAWDRTKPKSNWDGEGGHGAFEIAARWSTLDLSDGPVGAGEVDDITIALNWYPNPATRMMLDYILTDAPAGDLDSIVLRWQVDF